jgi:hypothetical protein
MTRPKSKYDPSEFVIPSSDQECTQCANRSSGSSLLNRAVEDVRKSGKFPFETRDDIVLWCLNEGLRKQSIEDAST